MALDKKTKKIEILSTKLKKGDKVKIIAGKHKGTVGPIIKVLRDKNRVMVEGITMKKSQKKLQNQEAGIFDVPSSVHISNVMIIDGKSGKKQETSRLGYIFNKENKKIRVYKKSGSEVHN